MEPRFVETDEGLVVRCALAKEQAAVLLSQPGMSFAFYWRGRVEDGLVESVEMLGVERIEDVT